ncbi:Zinc finger protein MAGPIE [Capsicum chinense]|uniref:Zinc finger protein MAGPIE n=1 Tax=Capsicum annuum TaxID=4072 RepID=A0A2G2Y0C3_CAPAN|nr:zinc finger protein GAI-ASSOCIATED FACTOR 1 [Capsicum annuum]KAF3646267.1 Zinc finger protein MAGPIE [Capsicum annuum]PHT63194.1 Zinc finger protein MAGPIE [Capsicum annuum]PHT97391.1 Zinc finger protein MAGPIE [Capsicum chinense]
MSNLSYGNSSTEEADETPNVLSSTTSDGSSVHQEQPLPSPNKRRRKLPGNPDPSAEVIALSPKTLMATNRFICEVCNKGFQREQNLQLHRRGHNLPWKLKQKTSNHEIKKRVYICPESSCVHHDPARALGDLTGIKKHFSRKHGEKKWKCDKCSKKYAVQSDWKAHLKTCGTKEYKCDCGTIFSRRDSFVTHRAFCDALAEENNKVNQVLASTTQPAATSTGSTQLGPELISNTSMLNLLQISNPNIKVPPTSLSNMAGSMFSSSSGYGQLGTNSSNMSSATALLQQAAQMGATVSSNMNSSINVARKSYRSPFNGMQIPIISDHDQIQPQIGNTSVHGFAGSMLQNSSSNNDSLTLDFLGIGGMRQRNLHEIIQQQQQQEMSFEQQKEVGQQSIQGMNSMWDD